MPFWSREENKEPHEPVGGDAGDHSASDDKGSAPELDAAASDASASEISDGHPADSGYPPDPQTDANAGEVPQPDSSEPEEGSSEHPLAGEPAGFDGEPEDGSDTGEWAATWGGANDAGPDPADSESSWQSRDAFGDYPQAPSMQSDLGHAGSSDGPSASEATPETVPEATGGSQPQDPGDAAQSWAGDADSSTGLAAGEGPPPPPSDTGELQASGLESEPASRPYAPVTDSSFGSNGDSVAGQMEPESDVPSTGNLPVAPRAPGAPDDRIRELFRKRQTATNSSATPAAPISATAEPIGSAEPQSPRQTPQPDTDVPPPREESKSWLPRLLRRRAKGEKPETEGSVSTSPRTGRKTKPVAPELLPWEPRGAAFRFKQWFKGRRVTISIEPDATRVVVSKGREIIAWGSVQVENSAPVGDEPGERPAERLKALLADLGAGRSRVITDLPLNAVLTRHMQLPKMRRRYIEQVVRSELQETTPFALDEMDLTWQARANGTDHDILAVTTSRETIDNHVRAMAEAGVRAGAVFSKATALAHAAGVSDAIVANIGASKSEFVLISGWVPQAVYEERHVGDAGSTPKEQAEHIVRAVEEVASYAQGFDTTDSAHDLPVLLTGETPDDGPLAREIRQILRRETITMAPPLAYPEHFPPGEYATNVGLILAEEVWRRTRGKTTSYESPALNVLPARHLPRPLPAKQAVVLTGMLLLGAVAFQVGDRVDAVAAEQATLSERLSQLNRQERSQRLLSGTAQATESQIRAAASLTGDLETHLSNFNDKLDSTLERLDVLTRTAIPPDVRVSSFGQQGDGYGFGGSSPTVEAAIQYMKNLRESGLFTEAMLHQVTISGEEAALNPDGEPVLPVSFQASVEVLNGDPEDE